MGSGIILVAGVSGAGKSTLCRHLADAERGIHHLVASSFVDGDRLVDQLELAGRIRAAAEGLEGTCLVDGHVIVGGGKVPREAVAALAPKGILAVTGSPADIVARRAGDTSRSRPPATEEEIRHAQQAEIGWARELAGTIGVPFRAIDVRDEASFRAEVRQLLGTP